MMELFHFYRHRRQGRLPEESGLAAQTPRQALPPPPPETSRRALPPPPPPETPSGPYTSSEEHLWDELRRIDLLVRAQTVRWWLTIAASKPQKWWGMVCVTDAEVEAYLDAPFTPPHELPPEVEGVLADYWRAAETLAQAIHLRLEQTPPHLVLRLVRLR